MTIVHAGPGLTQPEGVDPGVSHLLASPPETDVVMPGPKFEEVNEAVPVILFVISVILTMLGVQGTLGFQELELV